jgi:hypothetical protein
MTAWRAFVGMTAWWAFAGTGFRRSDGTSVAVVRMTSPVSRAQVDQIDPNTKSHARTRPCPAPAVDPPPARRRSRRRAPTHA